MKATEARLLDFLKASPQFVIPIYQRTYSWEAKECRQLWNDVLRAGHDMDVKVHFIGSVVYIESGLSQVTHQAPLLVIDGQQRLTTVSLLLSALIDALGEDDEPRDGFTRRKLRNYYLVNPEESGERHYKLLLTQTDRASLKAAVMGHDQPAEASRRVTQNLELFRELVGGLNGDLAALCGGLAKLVIVDVALTRDQDNPQLIFESMNSTGRELSQADLIRNYILMGLEHEVQTDLYERYWRPMELEFGQEAYGRRFDGFMRDWLTVKTGDIPNVRAVYEAFKTYATTPPVEAAGIETLVRDIREYARGFCRMALDKEPDPRLKLAFHDLRELKVDVAYPFLLDLYRDYELHLLTVDELLGVVRMIESYVFRRAMCAIPTNSLNKTFSTFGKSVFKDRYVESIKAHFALLPSYRRFPSDEEFDRELRTRDLYHARSRGYALRRLENHGRKERVAVDQYTIEHILPQNPDLSEAWRAALGPEYQRVQQSWLHTLGNLTLTGYNSEYSDRPFSEKRDMTGGFRESPLRLNEGLARVDTWNEEAIVARAGRLARLACTVWGTPDLTPEVLDTYRPEAPRRAVPSSYSRGDHPYIAPGSPMGDLFDAFRREVLALDPVVAEEYLKLYVAFKAETNFVDVVPQASRLRLSLNMTFPDITDPEGLCKDVTNLGRWGNGDVEVPLERHDQLPYVLGLVRQAFERQMGDAAAEPYGDV